MPRSASRRNASTLVTTEMKTNTKPPPCDPTHPAHTRQELNSAKPVQQSEPQRRRRAATKPLARHSNEFLAPPTTATTITATTTTTPVSMGVTSSPRKADVSFEFDDDSDESTTAHVTPKRTPSQHPPTSKRPTTTSSSTTTTPASMKATYTPQKADVSFAFDDKSNDNTTALATTKHTPQRPPVMSTPAVASGTTLSPPSALTHKTPIRTVPAKRTLADFTMERAASSTPAKKRKRNAEADFNTKADGELETQRRYFESIKSKPLIDTTNLEEEEEEDEDDFDVTLSMLRRLSVVKVKGKIVSVHELVQDVCRFWSVAENRERWEVLKKIGRRMTSEIDEESKRFSNMGWSRAVGVHGGLCMEFMMKGEMAEMVHSEDVEVIVRLAMGLSFIASDEGEYITAEKHAQIAYDLVAVDESLLTADALQTFATIMRRQGLLTEALGMYQRALVIRELALGSHVKTAKCLRGIATVLRNQGHLDMALQHYKRALSMLQMSSVVETFLSQIPDSAHRHLLALQGEIMEGMGTVFQRSGKLTVALEYYERSRAIFETSTLSLDPRKAILWLRIALLYSMTGRNEDALEYYAKRALAMLSQLFGEGNTRLVQKSPMTRGAQIACPPRLSPPGTASPAQERVSLAQQKAHAQAATSAPCSHSFSLTLSLAHGCSWAWLVDRSGSQAFSV